MTKNDKATRWMLAVCGAVAATVGTAVMAWREPDTASVLVALAALTAAVLVFSLGPD